MKDLFRDALQQVMEGDLLDCCYKKEWVVYCKPPFKTAACVVEYLERYTHRVAISNNRLLKLADGKVTFKWRDYKVLHSKPLDANKWKEMTVTAEEFIRRFLMHILPHGSMKIRHYGFLASRSKAKKAETLQGADRHEAEMQSHRRATH